MSASAKTADDIAAEYDLTLADVHAALAYYFDHRDEIDRRIADDHALLDARPSARVRLPVGGATAFAPARQRTSSAASSVPTTAAVVVS